MGRLDLRDPWRDEDGDYPQDAETDTERVTAMATHGSVAKSVRIHKENHPELYCRDCLWLTGGGQCPRHGGPPQPGRNADNYARRMAARGKSYEYPTTRNEPTGE